MAADQSGLTAFERGKLYELPLGDLLADPRQPRKVMDAQALEELAASIAAMGVVQPIIFRDDGQGNKMVVAGERRVMAARKAGLATIPAIFIDGNHAEIAVVENLLRQDLTPIEEAEGLQALMDEQSYSQEQLAAIIGKSRQTINEILIMNNLPLEVRDDCRGDRVITKHILVGIARRKQTRAMVTAYNTYKAKQQKTKSPRLKTAPNAAEPLIALIDRTKTRLDAVDMANWSNDNKIEFHTILSELRERIETFQAETATPSPTL